MKVFWKIFLFLIFFIFQAEGKLDIKCINKRKQKVDISQHESGSIFSPGYTERKPYPNNMECEVMLVAQKGKHVRLTFTYIDIAENEQCSTDRLVVTNFINDTLSEVIGMYCGYVRTPDFISTSNRIGIQFQSSNVGTGIGFQIKYKEVSNTNLCAEDHIICRNRKCIPKENNLCNGKDDCGDGTDEEDCDYPAVTSEKCGTPDVQPSTRFSGIDRIVGGREAIRGSWPWQVDLQLTHILRNGHFCGGTLLNSQWFITAAHCIQFFREPFQIRAHLGKHYKHKKDSFEQMRYVKDYFVYGVEKKDFMMNGIYNESHDIILVKMNAPVKMSRRVQPACLPQLNEQLEIEEKCFATGWGMTRGSGSDNVLKQAQYPIQPDEKCNNDFLKFESESMICAGQIEQLHGLCHGDSGGPLVCKKEGKWHVYGIASYLTDSNFEKSLCGLTNVFAVFNKVSHYIDWIKSTISHNS